MGAGEEVETDVVEKGEGGGERNEGDEGETKLRETREKGN